jgi:putative heme iron utilization protein
LWSKVHFLVKLISVQKNQSVIMSSTPIQETKNLKPRTPQVNELLAQCKSVILSTVNEVGKPNASYAPFARLDNKFYILVSFMAVHTKNLRDRKTASIMFIEEESAAKQIYARDRLTLDVSCSQIAKNTPEWEKGIELLKEKHGKILDVLVTMEDFIMIELSVLKGAYVNGFGSAYYVNEHVEIIKHRNDVGHGTTAK